MKKYNFSAKNLRKVNAEAEKRIFRFQNESKDVLVLSAALLVRAATALWTTVFFLRLRWHVACPCPCPVPLAGAWCLAQIDQSSPSESEKTASLIVVVRHVQTGDCRIRKQASSDRHSGSPHYEPQESLCCHCAVSIGLLSCSKRTRTTRKYCNKWGWGLRAVLCCVERILCCVALLLR